MRKRERKKVSGGSWMDTYGDMVTLLLCFFVLLYSISTLDKEKFENFVKSMNPDAVSMAEESISESVAEESTEEPQMSDEFEQMYQNMVKEFESLGLDANVKVVHGDGYNFITFDENIFFDGDSYVIRPEGRQALDALANAIAPAAGEIKEFQVLGHTTQALADRVNESYSDRMLSAERSAQVATYMQNKNLMEPARLVSLGYGQFRPIASFATEAERKKNRRVEILITDSDSVQRSLTEYYRQVYGDEVANMQPDAASAQ